MAVFGQTLLTLKIYSARNMYYRFSALIASARTHFTFATRVYAKMIILPSLELLINKFSQSS